MVNSGSFDSDGQEDRNAKTSCTQPHTASDSTQSSSPVTASAASSRKTGCSQTADSDAPLAIGPTPTKTEFNSDMPLKNIPQDDVDNSCASEEEKSSLCCSLPLEKVQVVLPAGRATKPPSDDDVATPLAKPTRKLLCLYCDRTFVSANLRQKHVERIHSAKKNRRVSSRKQSQFAVTQCVHCNRLNATENNLTDLFQHLVNEHSNKYFGCIPCEDRFLTSSLLFDHNAAFHQSNVAPRKASTKTALSDQPGEDLADQPMVKITRSRVKPKPDEPNTDVAARNKSAKLKELRCKKMSIKSSRIALKRRESKRLQALAKLPGSQKRRTKPSDKKQPGASKTEQINSTKSTEKTKSNLNCVNPYPEFDNFYRVKKITDHSIDNLKISSLTFDDVFDKAFFNRIKCNIEENLLHHIDGKLFKNEESETRISNFEKVSTMQQEIQNSNSDNYGCELSLNAVTPVPSLSLNSQFGEDFESQIEYGSKPSKKKNQIKKDEVHYKYFTRRKFQASILEQKENRDLSKLDMWTQLVIKNRQQKIIDDNKTAREILEYNTCNEYRSKLKREELNRILDRRGPFEDLREEASKKAALDKLNSVSEDSISHESFSDVREVLDEILNRVFAMTRNDIVVMDAMEEKPTTSKKQDLREIPSYLNLQRSTSQHGDIDKSDKITLICSSQETENFELPTNQVRGKNELVELSGEWARSRMYICAACGAKLPNMKYLLEHKTLYHQNVWVQHYEFVGNQSELYRHLSIPALGKVGAVETSVQCKLWKRSEARLCTKCGKQCNSLGELHRHVLECGGDWTWMLARKKCKYRPFGAKSRKKRRGLVQRIRHKQKTGPTEEKKKYKKTFNGPRQRPSDADTIQRMLANLPAKRSTRKLISLYDGVYRARKNNQMQQNVKQKKVKCGKMIYKSSNIKETTEKTINTARVAMPQKNSGSSRRSLRSLNRVLSSRILDTNTKLTVKRKIKVLNERRRTRQSLIVEETIESISESSPELSTTLAEPSQSKKCKNDKTEVTQNAIPVKRTSPRSTTKNIKKMSMKKLLTGNINIKSFFPVKKRENKKAPTENQHFDASSDSTENKTKNKKLKDTSAENKDNIEVGDKPMPKKTKGDTFGKLVRSLSIRKKKIPKISPTAAAAVPTESPEIRAQKKTTAVGKALKEELDKTSKKRKLKRSFRNVINRVKRLKIDNAPETVPESCAKDTTETNIKSTFLEERQPEKPNLPPQPVKIVVPSNLEAKENTADISETAHIVMNFNETNESSIVPENIFKLESNNEKNLQAKGELNFDMQPDSNKNAKINRSDETYSDIMQPITIETSEKPKIVPLISPNMKGKIRKPARGLNDCIAMLTNKLQQKTSETIAKVGILHLLPSKCAPKMVEDPHPPKTECILRIPTFKTQGTIEETALDLTIKPKTSFLNQPLFGKLQISNPLQNLVLLDSSRTPKIITKFSSIDRTIEDVVENKSPNGSTGSIKRDMIENESPKDSSLRPWNSVDDIIQTVVRGYQQKGFQDKPRTTVDDTIDFVIAGNRCEDQQDFTPLDTLMDFSKYKTTKSSSVSDIDLINAVRVEKSNSANELEQKTSDISTGKDDITRRSESISDTIDFVIAGGGNSDNVVSTFNIETANVLIDESNSKPLRKIGTKRKQKKKNIKMASDDVEVPPTVEADVSEKNLCATSTEDLSRQDNVSGTNEEQENSIANNSGLNELDISRDTLDDANNIPKPPEVTETNIPLFRENSQNHDSLFAESLDTSLNKAFLQSPEVNPEQFVAAKVDKAARKVGQTRKTNKFKQRKAVTVENKAVIVENKTATVENKAVIVKNKVVTVENKALTAIIETHLDDLLDIKEMIHQTELSVSSFKVDSILLSSEPQTKDLLLSNEDEPHVFENKAVVQHNPSDSEDDIPLISLFKVNETNSNENVCGMRSALRLDQIDSENVTCLVIEELSSKKRSVSVLKPSLCDQSKDSGIETDKSEESVSVDSEKTNLYLPDTPESVDNEINQKHVSIEEPIIDNNDSCASAVTLSTDIQKKTEYSVSDSVHKEVSERLPSETPQLDISSMKFESPSLNIKKPVRSKPRKSKSKKAVITEFKTTNSCENADMLDKLILNQNIIEKNSDSVINELEPLTKVIVANSSTASKDIKDSENHIITTLQTPNKSDSGTQNIISKFASDEDIPKDSLVIIEGISNASFQNVNALTTNTIKNKKKLKSKPVESKPHIFNNANVDQNLYHLVPTVVMKNKSPGKKGRPRGKLSKVVENKRHEVSSNAHDSEDEITDTMPLSVLASKDIPVVSGLFQGLNEKEENKPILEKEESHFSLENNGTAASVVSPGDIGKLAGPSLTLKQRKNRRKIGKRTKKKITPKLFLSISKIMETTNENLLLIKPDSGKKPEPVFSESLVISESAEITSRTSDNMEVNELEIKTNDAIGNLAETDDQSWPTSSKDIVCHTENLLLSGTAKISRFNKKNSKQLDSLGAEIYTGNVLNNIESHTIKRVQRASRSLEKISDDGGINSSDNSVLPLTILTKQVNVTVTDSIVPNNENSNIFTDCIEGEENVGTLAKNENILLKLAKDLFEEKLNDASENTSNEINLEGKHPKIAEDLFEEKLNEASENNSNEINIEDKQVDIFLGPQNGNLLGLKAKKAIKKRSRSSKKTPISDNSPKYEAIAFGDEKISFIGEAVVDLVRCETQMLPTVSDAPLKDRFEILHHDRNYTNSEESQLVENSYSEQSERSTSWKNTISSESYSESFTYKALEPERSKWKSPESTIDNYLPKTPTKRRSRSLKSDTIISAIGLSTSIELDGLQGSRTLETPIKRNSRSLNNDRKDPSSADSPLSECRSSDRDLSESDVEFKIKTPPKRSPRSLRTRKTVSDIKTSLQNATKEKPLKEGDYEESESITQVKKKARSLKNQVQSFTSDEPSSATHKMKYLGIKDTEQIESNLNSRPTKPPMSRSLQNSFEVTSTDILNELAESINKGTEQTETSVEQNMIKTSLLSVTNSLIASVKTDVVIDGVNSGFPILTKGKKRTKSLKNDFKAYFTNELVTNTTDSKITESKISVEPSIYSDLMKAGDLLSLENKLNEDVDSLSKEEINTEIIASDVMNTQVKPLTKTRSRSVKNNDNSPSTNELPPIDIEENYEVAILKNNEYLASANEMPRTKNFKRSTSFKENSTSSMEKTNLNKTFDQNQTETEDVLSSSDIKILKPLDSEIKDWKIKRLNKISRFLKSNESISIEASNEKIPEIESEEKRCVEVNPELSSKPNCKPANLEFLSVSTSKVKQRRSKSLKVDKSNSSEVVDEKQLNLDKSNEIKTKNLIKRSRSLKDVITLPVSLNETFELKNPPEMKLFENVEVILNPLCSESDVLVKTDPKLDDKRNSRSLTKTDNEVTIISTQLLNETEQSGERSLDDNIDPLNFSELESSFENINKTEDTPVDQTISTTDTPIKRSRIVKTKNKQTQQTKINTPPLSDIKHVENIERVVDLVVMKSKENFVTNETYSRSLRKKLAINYSEIEENNDINNPSISNEKLLTNTVIVKDDTESSVDVKKIKSKKSIILVSDDLVAQNASNTTESSHIEVSTGGIDTTVDNMNLTGKNEEYSLKENVVDTASIHDKIVFDGNIAENKTIDVESIVLNTNKQPKKQTRNKKSFRKKRTKSKEIVKIHLKSPAQEKSNKDVENSSSSRIELTSDLVIEPVNQVTLKQLDIKEPPIKIIINTQKTRRKSKSIKKIGLKGQNDLFEDFALVIKKKRPIPIIAFTPTNTFTGETTYPYSLSRPAEALSDPAKDEDVIQADLDVSVEEMDMEIDEIPITSNIIENSLSLALPVSPEDGSILDTVLEKEKVIKINDRRKCNIKNKSIDSFPIEDLEPTETLELPLEQDVFPEIPLVPVLSLEILEKKTEFISPKKGKRKTKTLRKNLLKAAVAAEMNDLTENLIIESGVFSQPESITSEKTTESIPIKTCESVSSCSSFVLDEHVMDKSEPEEIPFTEKSVYETTDNQVLEEPSNKDRDIDRIYAFSETEDYEIDKPVELPRRLPRNKEARITPKVLSNILEKKCISIEEPPAEHMTKQKSKLFDKPALDQKQDTIVGEIKENDTEAVDNGRRKSMRSAKVKALENIHDDAVAELTDSERNKESKAVETIETEAVVSEDSTIKKNSGKKQKKSQKPLPLVDGLSFPSRSLDGEPPILADLVAELHGLEELENSIERELNAEVNEKIDEIETRMTDLPGLSNVGIIQSDATDLEENQERRRSRRGSKKVASYNENDLIDPLLDEIDGKRKPRKKDDKNPPPESKVLKKTKEPAKKLNSEELFDLLKASTTDCIYVPKQPNSFLNNFEDTARDLNHDKFDCTFEGVLEKSAILGIGNAVEPKREIEKIYEFTESPENSEQIDELTTKRHSGPIKQIVDDMISTTSNSSFLLPPPDLQDSSMDSNVKVSKNEKSESCYCEICNKSFIRIENLIKHRRTLTHIQKLSEIEAKEAEKSKLVDVTDFSKTADDAPTELPSDAAGSIVEHPSTVQSSFSNSHSLKLADIINDVLNKPVLRDNEEHTFSDIVLQNSSELQPEVKRYKSLGERKSFDSDNNILNDCTASNPFASKTTILEKQISLLEGIIENQATNNYIDDISISSDSLSGRQSPSEMSSKLDDDTTRNDLQKPLMDNGSFIKPVQYEEISEDSANLRNYEDQKLRKTLNRDEELFLECCSLLKSGSEVSSSYSNKRMHNKVISTIGLRQVDEPEWLEKKSLVLQEPQFQIIDDSDDNSRIPTPLGDSYDDDASNSNTISSNWDMADRALDTYLDKKEICDRKFHFEDISKEKLQDQNSLKFEGLISNNRTDFSTEDRGNFSSKTRADVSSDGSANDAKKIITKGARKVFEGLKVSIPTEELNLEEVLNCSPKPRKINVSTESHTESEKLSDSPTLPVKAPRKSKPVKKSQVGSNLLFKVNKKKVLSPTSGKVEENESKNYDVYDFEETQDNTDVFTKPDYRTFRTLKNGEPFNEFESETDSRDLDSFSLEPESITSSTSSQCSTKKPKAQENITKKKCMIMGRIFKNAAAKSKIEDIDEEIRDIPAIDNGMLVENYVADCKKVIRNEVKPKLSEKEINLLFDQLLENKAIEKESANSSTTKTTIKSKPDPKKLENKKKTKVKGKKRIRTNSESTDDEFSLNKTIKKRSNRKNAKEEDNCINLEQELKECIGVASRKSQRKCTSGKQNVLVEYWSSDESQFEALLESQRIEAEPSEKLLESPVAELTLVSDPPKEVKVPQEFSKPKTIDRKPHKKKTTERKKSKSREASSVVDTAVSNRRKRAAANPLYHWSSSSEDEANDLIEVKPLRDELEDDEDRPVQHGWIVGESPKKLVMMLAQAKGKKTDIDCVKEQGKKRTNAIS